MSRVARALGVATASAAAAAGAVVVARTQRRHQQSGVLELAAGSITVEAVDATDTLSARSKATTRTSQGPLRSGDEAAASALDVARTEGRIEGRRDAVRTMAGGVSMMSIGALITLLVLFAAGLFEPAQPVGFSAPVSLAPTVSQTTPTAPDLSIAVPTERTSAPAPSPISRPDPSTITIPAIGVNASVVSLGLTGGVLDVPEDFSETGWWKDGPEPGEVGPSVIVGHVDSYLGPAVFYNLKELAFDDRIRVTRVDGSVAIFAVRSSIQVDKDAFPTEEVYGTTDHPALRLITCSGNFANGSYLGNLIVTADLIEETPPPSTGLQY